ncbi:ABC transporter substrate-binding protein [Aureimonas endophytica]|uniref:ABC transporter substrate-binding protein n=1 Tax=Aureimonas endophytica TaxID=2027858 RepID=A0A917EEF1_9HYPH|nr:TRAP transporter substrate-binding protein [Aureimonas endophytica]GGE25285.1 ABC transporter substrate-binding protein [Aureimonas endophytica]
MDRRRFMRTGALGGVAAAGLAAPALAQTAPRIRWRCASAFPPVFDALHGGALDLARFLREATDGAFEIEIVPPGGLGPVSGLADAAIGGAVEMTHTASHYYIDKDPAYALGAALPFAMNARALEAWLLAGGGIDLLNGFFEGQGLRYLPGGNTGAQMGGWFRREINAVQDLKGLKIRAVGLAGEVMKRLGAVPQPLPVEAIAPALERGELDAAEWVGPYDDEKAGFAKLAPFYYYPGWWEGSLSLSFLVNKDAHDRLPPTYRSLLAMAARAVTIEMQGKYDFRNPAALARLVAGGAQLRPFPQDMLNAAFDAANKLYGEIAGRNPAFKTIHDSMMAFRAETYRYQQVPEYTFDTFMMIKQREGALGGA